MSEQPRAAPVTSPAPEEVAGELLERAARRGNHAMLDAAQATALALLAIGAELRGIRAELEHITKAVYSGRT